MILYLKLKSSTTMQLETGPRSEQRKIHADNSRRYVLQNLSDTLNLVGESFLLSKRRSRAFSREKRIVRCVLFAFPGKMSG